MSCFPKLLQGGAAGPQETPAPSYSLPRQLQGNFLSLLPLLGLPEGFEESFTMSSGEHMKTMTFLGSVSSIHLDFGSTDFSKPISVYIYLPV